MNKDAIVIDGQKAQENVVPVETAAANDAMQKTGISETAGFASTKIKNMISAPDFRSGDGFISADELEKRKNIAWAPEFVGQSAAYTEDFTSDTGTIIADSVKQFGMSLMTMGDKAQIGLGGILSKLTGGAIGEEMRDRAYESLEAAASNIRVQNTHAADAETLTAAITQGAASMLEMMAVSLMTGGVAPLAQMGVEVFGDGMYNNMIAYAKENGGSIEGYEGNWGEIGIDLLNAAVQVGIERKLGLGSGRFLKRTGGHFLKEAIEGAAQEGSQAYLTDLGEWIKDNAEAPTNWENYIVSAAIGGFLQGALGAATYKNARLKADGEMAEMFYQAKKRKTPDRDEDEMRKEARSDAKQFNDDVEDGIVKDGWEEFANRVDTNNDRGVVRDNLVKEFTKARVAALGLESENDLDADDIADIQDAATIAAAEAFRESVVNGVSIMDTMTARLVADGNKLVVRDLKPEERGVAEKAAGQLETISIKQEKTAEEQPASPARADSVRQQEPISAIASDVIEESPETQKAKRISDKVKQVKERKKETNKTTKKEKTDADRLVFEGSEYDLSQITREDLIRSENEKIAKYIKQKESERPKDSFESWAGKTNIEIADAAIKNNILPTYEKLKSLVNEDGVIVDSSENSEIANEIIQGIDWKNTLEILLSKYDILDQGLENWLVENFDNVIESFDESDMSKNPFLGYLDLLEREFSKSDYNKETQELMNKYEEDNDAVGLVLVPKSLDKLIDSVFQNIALQYQEETDAFLQLKDNFYKQKPEQILLLQPSLNDIASGKVRKTGRGAYDPRYQRIILNKDSDISTILHELSHMWLNNWFKAYRSENAPESFKKWWKPVEKALGIRESDRFLNKDASEKFARGFEKWVMDGGKGGADSLQPVYDRLSKRLADIYDDLATRYFDMVADLKPEVNAWFAQNEYVADGMVVDVVDEEGVPTGETTRMEPTRNRAEERRQAMAKAESDAKMESTAEKQAEEINNIVEGEQPALAPTTDEPAKSIYTSEGKKEHKTSRTIRDMASAEGILVDVRNEYDPHLSKRAAEDAAALVKANYDWAVEIALGRQNPPRDLPREVVFVAVRNAALARKDAITLNLLAQSPVIKDVSAAAQKLALMKNYTGNGESNIPKILSDLARLHEEKLTEKEKAEIAASVERINKLIEQADLNYEDTWNNILNDNECK